MLLLAGVLAMLGLFSGTGVNLPISRRHAPRVR